MGQPGKVTPPPPRKRTRATQIGEAKPGGKREVLEVVKCGCGRMHFGGHRACVVCETQAEVILKKAARNPNIVLESTAKG